MRWISGNDFPENEDQESILICASLELARHESVVSGIVDPEKRTEPEESMIPVFDAPVSENPLCVEV